MSVLLRDMRGSCMQPGGGEEEEERQPFLLTEQTDGCSQSCLPLTLARLSRSQRRRRSNSHEGFHLAGPVRIWPQAHSSPELLHKRHVSEDHTSRLGAAAEKRAAARAAGKTAMEKAAERAEAEKAAMENGAADMEAAEKQAAEKETAEKEAAEKENDQKQLERTLSKLGSACSTMEEVCHWVMRMLAERLRTINLGFNNITDVGAAAIVDTLKCSRALTRLQLNDNRLGTLDHLSDLLTGSAGGASELVELRLSFNRIGDRGAMALAEAWKNGAGRQVREVLLASNMIGTPGAEAIASAVSAMPALQECPSLLLASSHCFALSYCFSPYRIASRSLSLLVALSHCLS
ncbi:MAG: hypothetical protein SGPRY_014531 [Prymnesium sp.]